MLFGFTVLLVCQLAGEVIARLLHLPVPGPVLGMVFLLIGLMAHAFINKHSHLTVPTSIKTVTDGLLNNLALLYVPAGVGLMEHFKLLSKDWLVISVALVVSTVVTMAVTALVLKALTEHHHKDHEHT